jgi:hypothetical protein
LSSKYCSDVEAAGQEIAAALVGDVSYPTPDQAAAALALAGNSECPSRRDAIWAAVQLGGQSNYKQKSS